jgi:gas vesicle protein GvpA/GvpJ/GvpM family
MAPADRPVNAAAAEQVLDAGESTLLDLLDNLLNKGVMANGDVTLGVAGIDLIYLRLSALLCAADRVLPVNPEITPRRKRRRARPRLLKNRL